jgi:hypothetical protein
MNIPSPAACLAKVRNRLFPGFIAAAILSVSLACCPVTGAEAKLEKPAGESFFKGHRLTTFLDQETHRMRVELDEREIASKDDVTEIGKPTPQDLVSSLLYVIHVKTTSACGSFFIVRVPVSFDPGKSEVLPDFSACNSLVTTQTVKHDGWASWSAVSHRDDLATAQIAFIQDEQLVRREVRAPLCLFVAAPQGDCIEAIVAEAAGYGERGTPTGVGTFGDQKIATFLNRSTGKATLELNGRVLRTFNNVQEFYLSSVDGANQFGLFAFFLKPEKDCATRPLLFFATKESQPEVNMDFGKCTEQMIRQTRTNGNVVEWSGIAYHLGDPQGYIASVIDHKLSTRRSLLPGCMMEPDQAIMQNCVQQALSVQGN